MSGFWSVIGRLGEAQILLPALLCVTAWLAWRSGAPRTAIAWLAAIGVAGFVTTLSKVAFIGWGIGFAPLDFTGFSGHAMFAAAVIPLLAYAAVSSAERRWHAPALGGAYAVAALVAASRVATHAHSPSEAVAGFALGGAASGLALALAVAPTARAPRALLVGLVVWMIATPASAPPSRTHDWVTSLSLTLSGRPAPYTRQMMLEHRQERLRSREASTAAQGRRGPAAPPSRQ